MTKCRLARPIFVEQEMHSNVACLLAETLLKMVLTFQRNIEVVRTYERATKGRHETAHVLRYVPQADENSNIIRTADVLRFVQKGPDVSYRSEKLRENGGGEPAHARGSSLHTCMGASTCDTIANKSMQTPSASRFTRRKEFNLIKSHEKEALYLSERFGDRVLDTNGGRNLAGSTLVVTNHPNDPGFAPEVLHLSKGKIDQSLRLPHTQATNF